MSIFEAIIQGILQGITEFLPVSSSGHLALFQNFVSMEAEHASFTMAFLHLGTLVAVFVAFRETIWRLILEAFRLIKDLFTRKIRLRHMSLRDMNEDRKMIIMLLIATVPLLIVYPFKSYYDALVDKGGVLLLGLCFLYTSAILFISDRRDKGKKEIKDMKSSNAFFIGVCQCIALLPGISRSGSTIGSSLIAGFSKEFAVKFSFVLGIPAILGGCLVEIKDAVQGNVAIEVLPMLVGFVVAAVVGYLSIKMISWLVKTDKYKVFAYYTLVVGIVSLGIHFVK